MTMQMMSIAQITFEAEQRTAGYLDTATKKLGRFTVAELRAAKVYSCERPDTTNPGGYWDRWVILERPILFGLTTRSTILYFEPTSYDDSHQELVLKWAKGVVDAIQAG